MIKDEYTIENDYPLMESINHYAKIQIMTIIDISL